MKKNPYSQIVFSRLKEIGLSQIPASVIAIIEQHMVYELAKIAVVLITPKLVSRSILVPAKEGKLLGSNAQIDASKLKTDRA